MSNPKTTPSKSSTTHASSNQIKFRHRYGSDYLRSSFFGAEDSLVSTTGLVAGLAAGSQDVKFILLGGIVAVAVEAVSMGAGQYLSQKAVGEYDGNKASPIGTGVTMFFAYIVAGAVPIAPMVFLNYPVSLFVSVGAALTALYVIGFIKGKIVNRPASRSGFEVLVIGGLATMIGLLVGVALKI